MILKNEINSNKKNIIFDIDGTLIYYDTLKKLINEALSYYGFEHKDSYIKMQVEGVINAIRFAETSKNFNYHFLVNEWSKSLKFLEGTNVSALDFGNKMIDLETKYIKEIRGSKETLQYLYDLKYLLLGSTNWMKNSQINKLSVFNMNNYFKEIYTCENFYAKPNFAHFQKILDEEQIDIKDTIMIGDSQTDILCKNYGLDSILFDQNINKEKIYDDATAVITEISDLRRILTK